jgi:hypothetical protein
MEFWQKLTEWAGENIAYGWFIMLALWGGTANYVSRQRRDKTTFSIIELIGEWAISGFSGIITAYICVDLDLSFALTSAAAGIAGHMGGRAVYLIEQTILRRMDQK